jgi:hypothetical protein
MKSNALIRLQICVLFVILLSPLTAFRAEAITWLGGVNLAGWCQEKGGVVVTLQGSTAYNWHCTAIDGREIPVSVLDACRFTYHDQSAVDWLGNFYNPYSWACFTNARQLPIDLNGYCKHKGFAGVEIAGPTAYQIYCLRDSGEWVELSPNAEESTLLTPGRACQWTWGNMSAIARIANFNDPNSWQCFL